MRIAIVDDNKADAEALVAILNEGSALYNIPNEITVFSSGEAFLESFNRGKYELIYMDIYMSGMTGIETGKKLREADTEVPLVFLTTSSDFMPEAFSCHAFDYVIKPTCYDRICEVMKDVLRTFPMVGYFELIENGTVLRILDNTLVAISVSGHTTCVLTSDGVEHNVRQSFSAVTEKLVNRNNFLLVNRGIMVCMDFISDFSSDTVYMNTGHTFSVNLRKHNELEAKWHEYVFMKLRSEQRRIKSN